LTEQLKLLTNSYPSKVLYFSQIGQKGFNVFSFPFWNSFKEDWISTLSITASNDINEDTLYSLAQQVKCHVNIITSDVYYILLMSITVMILLVFVS